MTAAQLPEGIWHSLLGDPGAPQPGDIAVGWWPTHGAWLGPVGWLCIRYGQLYRVVGHRAALLGRYPTSAELAEYQLSSGGAA